jgi:hypothetical protein
MNTTRKVIEEIALYETHANKFKGFKLLKPDDPEYESILILIKDMGYGAMDMLDGVKQGRYEMPEDFRKEFEERVTRFKTYEQDDFDNLYYHKETKEVNGKKQVFTHIMSLSEM